MDLNHFEISYRVFIGLLGFGWLDSFNPRAERALDCFGGLGLDLGFGFLYINPSLSPRSRFWIFILGASCWAEL
jgi:hypothetical protein